jgi:AraC-like DNA-binding protein
VVFCFQHTIDVKLIENGSDGKSENAKEKIYATNLSVCEIAYELDFELPQSFNKLFKIKTNVSPLKFR